MNKTGIIAVIIVIALAAYWWYSSQHAPNPALTQNAPATETPSAAELPPAAAPEQPQAPPQPVPQTPAKPPAVPAGKVIKNGSTYTSLLTQKGNYECDYDQVTNAGQSRNVIYLSNGKMRAEFRAMSGSVTNASLAVYDGHYLYSWKEGSAVGTKSAITSLGQLPAAIPHDLTSGKIYGTAYESVGWICHAWIPNPSLLAPPSYVRFSL